MSCCSTHTMNGFCEVWERAEVEVNAIEYSYTKPNPQCSCFQSLHSTNNKQRIELELRHFSTYLYRLLYYYIILDNSFDLSVLPYSQCTFLSFYALCWIVYKLIQNIVQRIVSLKSTKFLCSRISTSSSCRKPFYVKLA